MKRVAIFIGLKLAEVIGVALAVGLCWFAGYTVMDAWKPGILGHEVGFNLLGIHFLMFGNGAFILAFVGAVFYMLFEWVKWNWRKAGKMSGTLIILFLLSPYAWSQYPPSQSKPDAYTLRDCLTRTDSSDDGWFTDIRPIIDDATYHAFIHRQLTDWKAYTEECANYKVRRDRMDDFGDTVIVADTIWLPESDRKAIAMRHDKEQFYSFRGKNWVRISRFYWTSEPKQPTLPGFMLYLERKYPQKGVKP